MLGSHHIAMKLRQKAGVLKHFKCSVTFGTLITNDSPGWIKEPNCCLKKHTKYYFSVLSLCVHPDMVTIATGQVAGNSKDGKVTVKPSHAPPGCRFWDASMCCLNPVCLFHFWIFSPSLLMFAFGTPWPSTRFTLSGWERSTERSHAWLSPSR